MIKEAREDYKRHKMDVEVNNRPVEVLDHASGEFQRRKWQDVRVGEIIMVTKNHFFPADLLFLTAENEEGTCYVETMNLDGETNLKIKKALDESKELTHGTLKGFKGGIECEAPNSRLYQFTGNLLLAPPIVPQERTVPISPNAILLRGCALRNTERVFGVVIYAGERRRRGRWQAAGLLGGWRGRGRRQGQRRPPCSRGHAIGWRLWPTGSSSKACSRSGSCRRGVGVAPTGAQRQQRKQGRGAGCRGSRTRLPHLAFPSAPRALRPREQDLQERHGGALQAQPRGAHHRQDHPGHVCAAVLLLHHRLRVLCLLDGAAVPRPVVPRAQRVQRAVQQLQAHRGGAHQLHHRLHPLR